MRAGRAVAIFLLVGCGEAEELSTATFELLAGVAPGEHVRVDGIGVVIPERGVGLFLEVIDEDGATHVLGLRTHENGDVFRSIAPAIASEVSALHGTPPATCDDRAYALLEHRWAQPLAWSFHASTTPTGLSPDAVELELRRGTSNITRSRNNCGLDDLVSAQHTYLGRTDRGADVASDGSCTGNDGSSVVGFGALPTGTLGVTCTWYTLGAAEAVESDMRLNRTYRWYTERPADCSDRFGIQAVVTHERGHTFGLGHVSEHEHPGLTMSTRIRACSNQESTLGRGDVIGLRQRY
jgi:hypothetical protein